MKATHTILCPQMSPIHFEMLEAAFRGSGYRFEILPNDNKQAVDVGLKYVNNDACYPSLIVVGQIMEALLSGKYDLDKVAVIITQTGGGCRASNYIGFIRRALKKAGFGHVPVISLNLSGLEGNPGFKLTPSLIMRIVYGALFGDIFMKIRQGFAAFFCSFVTNTLSFLFFLDQITFHKIMNSLLHMKIGGVFPVQKEIRDLTVGQRETDLFQHIQNNHFVKGRRFFNHRTSSL